MKKHNAKGRSITKGLYVNIPFRMVDSLAFQALPPLAIALYVHIARRYNGENNGRISFSVREVRKALGVGNSTASDLFNELIAKGFLKVAQDSSFNFKQRTARRWELTQWPIQSGIAPSNDWVFWKPDNLKYSPATGTHSPNTGTRRLSETVSIDTSALN